MCAALFRQLHYSRTHTARGTCDQNALGPDTGAVQHALGGGIGAGDCGQFHILPVATHGVGFLRKRDAELGKTPIAFSADDPAFIGTVFAADAQRIARGPPAIAIDRKAHACSADDLPDFVDGFDINLDRTAAHFDLQALIALGQILFGKPRDIIRRAQSE